MNITILDRLISVLSYFTFGMFSIIWIIFANVTKKRISSFLNFNLYQSIFISIILYILSLIYSIAINFIKMIPFVGKFANSFDLFFNNTPIYSSFTISGLLVTLFVFYLAIVSLIGIKPKIPLVSDIIKENFGG